MYSGADVSVTAAKRLNSKLNAGVWVFMCGCLCVGVCGCVGLCVYNLVVGEFKF